MTTPIVRFIEDRITADEAHALHGDTIVEVGRAILQQCSIYRRILAAELGNLVSWDGEMCACDEAEVLAGHCDRFTPEKSQLLHALASRWRDHPDFRPEWAIPKD